MVKYKDFYKEILSEGRREDVLNKLKKIGKESELENLFNLDKTPSKKHVLKLADYYVEVKDLGIIESYYNRFIENGALNNKDIFQWKTFKDFENIVDSTNIKVSKAFGKIEEKPIYEDDNIRVFHGDSKEKCIKLSSGYTFCIGRNDGGNLYNHYRFNAETTFYFIRFKNKSDSINSKTGKYDDDDHYIVIQALTNGKYFLTIANNLGDSPVTKDQVIQKYPELLALFEKNIIKPVPYSDKEKYVMSKIKEKSFSDMETESDRILWAEFNPSHTISDFEFAGKWISDEFRKKYIETRSVDIPFKQMFWLEENRPALYERYKKIKDTHLQIKANTKSVFTRHEIALATDETFVNYIKNVYVRAYLGVILRDRGARGGDTAIQFFSVVEDLSLDAIETLIKDGIRNLDYISETELLKENEAIILDSNKINILQYYFIREKILYDKDWALTNDVFNNLKNFFKAFNNNKELTYLYDNYVSNFKYSDPKAFSSIVSLLNLVPTLHPNVFYTLLGSKHTREGAIEYFIDRYKEMIPKVHDELLYSILAYAAFDGEEYYEKIKKEVSKYVDSNLILDAERRIRGDDLSHLKENLEIKQQTVAYIQDGDLADDELSEKFPDFHEQINYLENTSNIGILRNKELNQVLIIGDKIVGALYTELDSDGKFSFDVIVHPEYRSQGLGDKLVKMGISEYKSLKNSYDEKLKLRVDVVNPQLFSTFKKNGLRVLKDLNGSRKIMGMN